MKNIVIYGGGTIMHVRNHMALCAPAYGTTARRLQRLFDVDSGGDIPYSTVLRLTKMANRDSKMETNVDVLTQLTEDVENPETRAIVFNVALCDFFGIVDGVEPGKYAPRLKTEIGPRIMEMGPTPKLLNLIRKTRKDIFLVAFKTTCGATPENQYKAGLKLLKQNSCNLVVANDTKTRNNMIIVPEEAHYDCGTDRAHTLFQLRMIMLERMSNTFTRSTVIGTAEDQAAFDQPWVPESFRQIVRHCVAEGAYKPVLGKTAGHFAYRMNDIGGQMTLLTSKRKSNFNEDSRMVIVQTDGPDRVIAMGAKPSVGGQSQRIVFENHPEADCIVHFHCPVKDASVPMARQWPFECGSHQCGQNTSDRLGVVDLGDGDSLKVVMLENHGPNVVFSSKVPAEKVINYIDRTFDLKGKTGGLHVP